MEEIKEIRKLIYDQTLKIRFKKAELGDGIAVIGYVNKEPDLAFYIKDNMIYAANGVAKAWTKGKIEYIRDEEITYFSILQAVKNKQFIKE